MDFDFWQPIIPSIAEEHVEEMQCSATSSLVRPGRVWRRQSEEEIYIRLLNESEFAVTFVSAVPMEAGEEIGFARDAQATRRPMHITRCEPLAEDIYRISAHS
jgi:hypothetical protein